MINIYYKKDGEIGGGIEWAESEEFSELRGNIYLLKNMKAIDINKISDLSPVAKLLLSAVAGAVIQHLIDQQVPINEIFEEYSFEVKEGVKNEM